MKDPLLDYDNELPKATLCATNSMVVVIDNYKRENYRTAISGAKAHTLDQIKNCLVNSHGYREAEATSIALWLKGKGSWAAVVEAERKRIVRIADTKMFYRVNHVDTQQGLWYDFKGQFTGNIHSWYNFCQNRDLEMDFDPEVVGWISATESLSKLLDWFPAKDITRLQDEGYFIHTYETSEFKWYERFKHYLIKQSSSVLVAKLDITQALSLDALKDET